MRITKRSAIAGLLMWCAGAASGQDVFMAVSDGRVFHGELASLAMTQLGSATVSLNGLDLGGAELFLTNVGGQVGLMGSVDGVLDYYIAVPGCDNSAIVTDGDALLLAGGNGLIRRVDSWTGAVLGTMQAPIEIDAMLLDGDTLYIAGPQGSVYRGDKNNGGFAYFACVCLGPIKGLADMGDRIIAGDVNGSHQTYRKSDGQIVGGFWEQGEVAGLVATGSEVITVNTAGQIRRVNPMNGQVFQTVNTGLNVVGMVMGTIPCGGDFDGNGFVTSADFDAFLGVFEAGDGAADHDGDGWVTGADFDSFVVAFESGC